MTNNNVVTCADITALVPGEVLICPTDTVYGLSCSVSDVVAVEKIKRLKYRTEDPEKHLIVLIGSVNDLALFGIALSDAHRALLEKSWPGPVSVIFSGIANTYAHLSHDGTLACRLPSRDDVRGLIQRVGPIVSTSANRRGEKPAISITEACNYFPEEIDVVIDGGICDAPPSSLIKFLR